MTSSKLQYLKKKLKDKKASCKMQNIPFDLDLKYLISIATDKCPIFGTEFIWETSGLGVGRSHEGTPQLDRITPELGYIKGNVAFLSKRANKMKDDGTMEEHYAIADWIWEQIHARENPPTPLSDGYYKESDEDFELRALLASGIGKDKYNLDDYLGAIYRQDFNYSAKTGGRDCVGAGDFEVEPSEASAYIEGIRYSSAKIIRHLNRIGYLHRKFRERCLADGAVPKVPELNNRRKQPIQRPVNQKIQSTQKAFEEF